MFSFFLVHGPILPSLCLLPVTPGLLTDWTFRSVPAGNMPEDVTLEAEKPQGYTCRIRRFTHIMFIQVQAFSVQTQLFTS